MSRRNSNNSNSKQGKSLPAIDPTMYLGYAEDGETVEMIVRKFEALEQFQREQEEARKMAASAENASDDTTPSPKKGDDDAPPPELSTSTLSHSDLQELFRRTSTFTVESANAVGGEKPIKFYDSMSGEFVILDAEVDGRWDPSGWIEDEDGELIYYLSDNEGGEEEDEEEEDDDDESYHSDSDFGGASSSSSSRRRKRKLKERKTASSRKKKKSPASSEGRREKGERRRPGTTIAHSSAKQHPSAAHAIVAMRVMRRAVDPNAILSVSVPEEPLPSSWARRILPYVPVSNSHAHTKWRKDDVLMPEPAVWRREPGRGAIYHPRVASPSDLVKLASDRGGFHGVVMCPPWREPRPGFTRPGGGGITPEELTTLLPLKDKTFLPCGFVYVWTPKHWLNRTLAVLEANDLHYVENATVVYERAGRTGVLAEPCTYFNQSKDTLLLCRRGYRHEKSGKITWEPVEMRHQRTSDVFLSCFNGGVERDQAPRSYSHKLVETMLPLARCNVDGAIIPEEQQQQQHGEGKLCELWSIPNTTRSGWVFVGECGT